MNTPERSDEYNAVIRRDDYSAYRRREDNLFTELLMPLFSMLMKVGLFVLATCAGVAAAIVLCWLGSLIT